MQSGSSLFDHIMASDRLTQLQDAVNTQAENFCNSVGILQQYAASGTFPEFSDIRTSMGNIGGGNAGSGTPSSTGLYGMANGIPLSLVSSASSTPLGGGGSTPNSVTSGLNLNEVQQPSTSSSSSSTCAVTSTTGPSTSPIKLESGIRFPPTPLEDLVKQELMVDSTSSPAPTVSSTTAASATASSNDNNNDNNVNSSVNANDNSNSTNNASTNAPTPNTPEDYGVMFARIIARTAKEIDVLIDSLPSTIEVDQSATSSAVAVSSGNNNSNSTSAADQFNSSIRRLEQENVESAAQLEETIRQGEAMLERIQNALAEIAQCQLKSAALDC